MALVVNKESNKEIYEYVPISERGEKKPFTFKIRRLTPKEFSFLEDKMARMNQDQTISFTTGTFNWELAKKGIVGWENLLDEHHKPIKPVIVEGGIADSSLNLLPMELITEVANVIAGITRDPENADVYLLKDTQATNEETESK